MKLFGKLLSLGSPRRWAKRRFDSVMQPEEEFIVIGDIHGGIAELDLQLKKILDSTDRPHIVCVGDYIDRGEHSAAVLARLMDLSAGDAVSLTCLMGNHEQMCLRFIDDPERNAKRWLHFGGLQTLASFGIGASGVGGTMVRDDLVAAMGDETIAWMRSLPTYWMSGNVAVTHAGADPSLPIDYQPTRNLLWGHSDLARQPRADGVWVVHGHTIVDQPAIEDGRVAIDTGAYATGKLTAARISEKGVVFAET